MVETSLTTLIPLLAFFAYCGLLALAWTSPRSRVARLFVAYLFLMSIWSLSSFLMRMGIFPGPKTWNMIMVWGMLGVPFVFFHFSQEILERKDFGWVVRLGYVFYAAFAAVNTSGLIVSEVYLQAGELTYGLGPAASLFAVIGSSYIIAAAVALTYGSMKNSASFWSNRLIYPSIGSVFMLIGSTLNLFPAIGRYPFDILANTTNAFLLAYAIYRHRLLNATIPIRKGVVNSIIVILMTVGYFLAFRLTELLGGEISAILTVSLSFAIVTAILFERFKEALQMWTDRAFFGQQYDYRETLKVFSQLMTSILDLDTLVKSTLELILKALHVNCALLLLPDEEGNFYSHTHVGNADPQVAQAIRLDRINPIIRRMSRQSEAILSWQEIETLPEFRGLWQREKGALRELGICYLVGMRIQEEPIGLLALSEKESGDPYTDDDRALLLTLANQAAIAIQNAQVYKEARTQAVRDDLTKLYNYRFLQDFLDKEMARSSRRQQPFSVVFVDLDFFKTYNDIYGHLAGDHALVKVSQAISDCIRACDVAARYGGDEFAVVLTETNSRNALAVAERIREKVVSCFQGSGLESLLTVSLGIASYPEHAASKQELLTAADAALYEAKRQGRNSVIIYQPGDTGLQVPDLAREFTSEAETKFLRQQVKSMYIATIDTLAAAIDARNNYTYEHSQMVTRYSVALADALGLSEEQKQMVYNAAMLHDIGKIGVPENILSKPGPLTPAEREVIQYHSETGEAILNQTPYLRNIAPIIRHHHEAYDGSGYPDGLQGEDIPLESRILAIADAYHAMTSDRPYRRARTRDEAVNELCSLAGKQFDPLLVPVFVRLVNDDFQASSELRS